MKKIICSIIGICLFFLNITSYASYDVSFEELPKYTKTLLTEGRYDDNPIFGKMKLGGYLLDIRGETYYVGSGITSYSLPVKVSGVLPSSPDCIWTGESYFVRRSVMDGYWPNARKYAEPIKLFDADGNEVKKFELRDTWNRDPKILIPSYNQHALKIGYLNGTYYCLLKKEYRGGNEKVIKSTDFETWEETDEAVPQTFGTVTIQGEQISLSGSAFSNVQYEDKKERELFYTLGEWIVDRDSEGDFYFSNDTIYFVKVNYPEELAEIDKVHDYGYVVSCVYEDEQDVIIDMDRRYNSSNGNVTLFTEGIVRLRFPKAQLYEQLDQIKGAPYVKYNNNILGFEEPPVIEEGRTLVPMRFLFEQMGAEVSWNADTQTAMLAQNTDTIAFSIDNDQAVVNGTATTMEVPARLINGKTMVPLRFLSEELGYTVDWDADTRIATIE